MRRKKTLMILCFLCLTVTFAACGFNKALTPENSDINTPNGQNISLNSPEAQEASAPTLSGKLVIEGSTSMQKIFQGLSDTFTAKNPKVSIEYIADGSSAGINAVIADTANIGTSSREVKEEERSQGLEVITIAEDAIALIVHPDNGVTDLTREQVAQIYKKEITNWKDVGGKDAPIVVVARDAASGTREAFESIFGVKDAVMADQEAAKTGEVITVIAQNPNAIGYISLAYSGNTVKNLNIDGMRATEENVINGTYTIKRPFNIVTKGQPDALEKAFIDFIFSEEGAQIISKEAVPVKRQ